MAKRKYSKSIKVSKNKEKMVADMIDPYSEKLFELWKDVG